MGRLLWMYSRSFSQARTLNLIVIQRIIGSDRRSVGAIDLPFLCKTCRTDDYSSEWNERAVNPRMCENCNFNFWRRNGGMTALRVSILWELRPDWKAVLPADDLRKFTIEGALILTKKPVPWVHGAQEHI